MRGGIPATSMVGVPHELRCGKTILIIDRAGCWSCFAVHWHMLFSSRRIIETALGGSDQRYASNADNSNPKTGEADEASRSVPCLPLFLQTPEMADKALLDLGGQHEMTSHRWR